jgi:hypothetical protein
MKKDLEGHYYRERTERADGYPEEVTIHTFRIVQ